MSRDYLCRRGSLRGINSECIDLIYLDPPFNKNKKFTAPIGSSAEGTSFKDIFREEDVKDEWLITIKEDQPELYHYLNGIRGVGNPYNFAYLAYMAIRLIECHRVLKKTGSIYLHCDPTMSHYLKTTLDCIFGEKNYLNEIIWCYIDPAGRKNSAYYKRTHDIVFWYTKSKRHHQVYEIAKSPLSESTIKRYNKYFDKYGKLTYARLKETNPGAFRSLKSVPADLNEVWLDKNAGTTAPDWWTEFTPIKRKGGNQESESVGYPTQKPLALIERIIKTSSNEEYMVLDPFCGCATTCVAAEHLNRQWIGIDISIVAYDLVRDRLTNEVANPGHILQFRNQINLKTDPPKRTDLDVDYREQKFVYIISHPSYPGEYKVGIAKNAQLRLVAYQTADPERAYKIKYKLETPHFREIEKHIHEIFPNKHEWVQRELNEIIKAIENYKLE
ncbi:MAG: DNA methyltransferase [Gammaproteobacteria bacterium]|nr:DNA methyltransferase [Gammaproteobacteria bacterium]